ncbi:MAG TPA: LysR family transcriptional regulator [Massilibacterium sp.]|nr:LysR family transcriptional regulator [Massilibacterium sp.]
MDIKDLRIFVSVAKNGTVSQAAKELNYVQSNVTTRIQKLEDELQTPLFHRHRKGMHLNPEGKKLLVYAKEIISLMGEMKKAMQQSDQPAGKLDIGSVETVIKLPIILSSYNQKYPDVDLSLVTDVTERLIDQVLEHQLDGAFVSGFPKHHDLIQHPVFEEELVLISNTKLHSIDELKTKPFLVFSKGCGYRAKLEQWLRDAGIVPKKMMEFGTLETILGSVVSGLGVTLVPKSTIRRLEKKNLIICHPIPKKYQSISTVFIQRADSYESPTMTKFIETINQCRTENRDSFIY